MPKKILKFVSLLLFLMFFSVLTFTGYSLIRNIESQAQSGSNPTLVSFPGNTFTAGAQSGGGTWSNISGDAFISGKLGVQTTSQNSRFEVVIPVDYSLSPSSRDDDTKNIVFGNGLPSGTSGHGGIRFGYNGTGTSGANHFGVINVLKPTQAWGNLILQEGAGAGGGNVGIGTATNPTEKLEVGGNLKVTGDIINNKPYFIASDNRASWVSGPSYTWINPKFNVLASGSGYSTTTGLYTAPLAGVYQCSSDLYIYGAQANAEFFHYMLGCNGSVNVCNGAQQFTIFDEKAESGESLHDGFVSVHRTVYLNAGDTIGPNIFIYNNSSVPGSSTHNYMYGAYSSFACSM